MGDARRRGARQHRANLGQYLCRASGAAVQAGEEVKFAADSLLEGAVTSEPVSEARKFPASRENTGNFIDSGLGRASTVEKTNIISILYGPIP